MKYRWLFHSAGGILSSYSGRACPTAIRAASVSNRKPLLNPSPFPIGDLGARAARSTPAVSGSQTLNWRILCAGALFLALSGCSISTTSHGWPGSYAPQGVVNAQDCVEFSFGQPSKFACRDGKVYTSWQLRELREKAANSKIASSY
jgi:hypothetical protein